MSKLTKISLLSTLTDITVNTNFLMLDAIGMSQVYSHTETLNKDRALNVLKNTKAAKLRVEYSGCGDEGQIQGVTFYDEAGKEIEIKDNFDIPEVLISTEYTLIAETDIPLELQNKVVSIRVKQHQPKPPGWKYPTFEQKDKIQDFIAGTLDTDIFEAVLSHYSITEKYFSRSASDIAENLGYSMIELNHRGYENDEGGSGTITFDFKTGKGQYQKSDNYTATEDSEIEFEAA